MSRPDRTRIEKIEFILVLLKVGCRAAVDANPDIAVERVGASGQQGFERMLEEAYLTLVEDLGVTPREFESAVLNLNSGFSRITREENGGGET
jgi:hypothetical protein